MTWNWSVVELWGENWDTDAHAHVTYQAPITGLHNPTLLPFLQNSTDYLKLAQSCKFGVTCCSIGLTHPAACTLRVCLWLLDISTDPPFNPICSKKVQIDWAWAQDSDDIFTISWEWPRKKLKTPQKNQYHGGPPPPSLPGFDSYIYQLIALDVRIPNI